MRGTLLMVVCLFAASPVAALDERQACVNQIAADGRLDACSRLISATPQDATAYFNRGVAYQQKGDFDPAIADFSKAIELNPNYGPAYNARGLAFVAKGDYVHALEDVMRANELQAKRTPVRSAQPRPVVTKKEAPAQRPRPRTIARVMSPAANAEPANSALPRWAPPMDSP